MCAQRRFPSTAFLGSVLAMGSLVLAAAGNTPSPNEPIPKPMCNSTNEIAIRYSMTTGRLYIESAGNGTRGGCVSLGAIWEARSGKAPLYAIEPVNHTVSDVSTGTWLLTEDLYIEDGITLEVHGSSVGGDADELRLLSTDETFINVRAYGASLDFLATKVISWDDTTNSPDVNETDGRSYISAISEVIVDASETCEGRAKNNMGEARMDIVDSEMGYLGFQDSESYGLTWKVRGFCKNKTNPEVRRTYHRTTPTWNGSKKRTWSGFLIFDQVNVYGNIYSSDIHHNRFGLYTYGHQQGDWRNNTMHDNSGYGFDPHDDSDFLTIHDNVVYNNGYHGIIASKRCNDVSIQGNEVYGGGATSAGIFLHRSSDNAAVKGNYVHDNGDAGMAFLESFNASVSNNTFENNKYGIRFSVGSADNIFTDNVMLNNSKYNVYTYEGSDAPDVVESGRPQNNVFSDNRIVGSLEAIKLKESDGIQFISNTFMDVTAIRFNDSTGVVMLNNMGLDMNEVELKVDNGACFDASSDADFEPVCD